MKHKDLELDMLISQKISKCVRGIAFKVSFVLSLFSTICIFSYSQFIGTPPLQDGVIGSGEYGSHVDGENQQTNGSAVWYLTWDASNLYVAITGSTPTEGGVIYFDTDPIVPVNGGNGTVGSKNWAFDYDRTKLQYPVRADFKLYFKDSYNEYRHSDGSDGWSLATANTITSFTNYATQTIEMVIPWNVVTNGSGRPNEFNWFGYKMYNNGDGDNGTYDPVPTWNPTTPNNAGFGLFNDVYVHYYYSIASTDNNASTFPFGEMSFTYHEDYSFSTVGGYQLGNATLWDLTIYDGSTDNNDNNPANDAYDNQEIANRVLITDDVTIKNNLYVGQGSALLPTVYVDSPISVDIIMNGSDGKIHNHGRIDCTPEAANMGDWDLRRLNFIIDGDVRIENSTVNKDRFRMSNITVNGGKKLIKPTFGIAEIELQHGTLDNNGSVEFSSTGSNYVDVGLRGDYVTHNDYFLDSSDPGFSGSFIFHDLLIGRFSSRLQPTTTAPLMNVQIKGNFENYGDFWASNGTGTINILMNGTGRQEIVGNVNETVGNRTTFNNLTILNDNLLNDDNNGADVHFVSYGGGTVQYLINGVLSLIKGDLVTRDRVDNSITHEVLINDAALISAPLAKSYNGSNTSCFVDGPLSFILVNRPFATLEFHVGKDASYRKANVTVYHSALDSIVYVGEVHSESSYLLNNALPTTPENVLNSSTVHYWRVNSNMPSAFSYGQIWVDYDVVFNDDLVTDPANLRVLQAPSTGNSTWNNISVGVGGAGVGTGSILSSNFFQMGDFTLGNVGSNPLPVELIRFEAIKELDRTRLEWTTASETNNAFFSILKSTDGNLFEEISKVEGMGNSNSIVDYVDYDLDPNAGWNYYKLLQVDFDGTEWESEIKAIYFNQNDAFSIWPNPAIDQLNISNSSEIRAINIIDNLGRKIMSVQPDFNSLSDQITVNVDQLAVGQYILQAIDFSGHAYSQKLIIE